jgi:hypothetical protein
MAQWNFIATGWGSGDNTQGLSAVCAVEYPRLDACVAHSGWTASIIVIIVPQSPSL